MVVETEVSVYHFFQKELLFLQSLIGGARHQEMLQQLAMGDCELRGLRRALVDRFDGGNGKDALMLAVIYAAASGQIILDSDRVQVGKLTKREAEIFARLAEGYRSPAIAEHVGVHKHAIEARLENVFAKLGVLNRFEAAALIHQRIRQSGGKLTILEVIGSSTNP